VVKTQVLLNKLCKNPNNFVPMSPVDIESMHWTAEMMFKCANGHTTLTSPVRSSPHSPIPSIIRSMRLFVKCGSFAMRKPMHLVNVATSSLITSCRSIAPPPYPKYNHNAGKNKFLNKSFHLEGIAFSQSLALDVEKAINLALSVRDDSFMNLNT